MWNQSWNKPYKLSWTKEMGSRNCHKLLICESWAESILYFVEEGRDWLSKSCWTMLSMVLKVCWKIWEPYSFYTFLSYAREPVRVHLLYSRTLCSYAIEKSNSISIPSKSLATMMSTKDDISPYLTSFITFSWMPKIFLTGSFSNSRIWRWG